jgi:hypothetical protein
VVWSQALRKNEAKTLRWRDVDLTGGTIPKEELTDHIVLFACCRTMKPGLLAQWLRFSLHRDPQKHERRLFRGAVVVECERGGSNPHGV